MTREHDDKRLSEAYRELAEEKVPAELDDRVLALATREARTRYGLARFWIRPVAWAAMIGLSLAIVLEVTRYADVTAPPEAVSTPPAADSKDDGRIANDLGKLSDAPAPQQASSPPLRRRDSLPPADTASDEFVAEEMELLQEADEQARMRAGEDRANLVSTQASFAAAAEKKEQAEFCEPETRAKAETWYVCIVALRDAGLVEPARLELQALERAFPEFRAPDDE